MHIPSGFVYTYAMNVDNILKNKFGEHGCLFVNVFKIEMIFTFVKDYSNNHGEK